MERPFVSAIDPPAGTAPAEHAWWFVFRGSEILVVEDATAQGDGIPLLPDLAELAVEAVRRNYLGALIGRHCYAVEIAAEVEPPPGAVFRNLRTLYGRIPDDLFALAGRAAQIVEWDRGHQFCGRCGTPTEYSPGERAKRCPACGQLSFPRLSPAIIVLVEREDRVLLARGTGFPNGMYSTLAGFVEPGESLEEAVHREIFEEAGIALTDLRYFGSQPWPFPHSLMIGFTAQYAGGEIVIDPAEIADARWFTVDTLPRVPQKLSIARRLIDSYVAKHGPPLDQP
jgi:NAD+ diphosphatase